MTTLIADSGSTKTDWALVDDTGQILFTGKTQGINPFHLSDDDIWKILAEELTLPEVPARVFFYGSGVTESMKPRMEHLLFQQFPQAEVHAESDLLGATAVCMMANIFFSTLLRWDTFLAMRVVGQSWARCFSMASSRVPCPRV